MGFAERHLNPNEQLILSFKPHWKALISPGAWTMLIAVALGAVIWIIPASWKSSLPFVPVAVAGAALAWCVLALPKLVGWLASEIVLTDERLVSRRGFIRRVTFDVPVRQIASITIHQGLIDRILRVGKLVVESSSDTGDVDISDVPHPIHVQNMIARVKDDWSSGADHDSGARPATHRALADRLADLDNALDQGLISESEYSAKRSELLRDA